MSLFDIKAKKNLLLYLVLPYFIKARFLSSEDLKRLREINYSWNSAAYSGVEHSSYNKKHGYLDGEGEGSSYPLLAILKDRFPKGCNLGHVLEIGAGSGFLSLKLLEESKKWISVEFVPEIAEKIKGSIVDKSRFELIQKDIFEVNFKEGEFDTVFLFYTLHHLLEREELFEKIFRWLKKGGKVYCLDPRHNLQRAISISRKYFKFYRKNITEKSFGTHDFTSKIEMRRLYKRSGFSNIEIEAFDFPLVSRMLFKDKAKQYEFEKKINWIPVIEHFGRFLYSSAVKP